MARKSINNDFYDTLGKDWLENQAHPIALLRAENALRNPWIAEIIKPVSKVLDIGCGAGLLTHYLASRGHQVFGVDLSEASLQVARECNPQVQYTCASAYALPYPDQHFDVVCAMDLLEHVDHPAQVIAEASRVLKTGGHFFFHTFNRNLLSYFLVIKGVEWCVPNTPCSMHVYHLFLKPAELKEMCIEHQLKIEQFRGVRPILMKKAFWKMVFLRTIDSNFQFTFTESLNTGYSGFAIKSI